MIIIPLHGPSSKLKLARIYARPKFQDGKKKTNYKKKWTECGKNGNIMLRGKNKLQIRRQ